MNDIQIQQKFSDNIDKLIKAIEDIISYTEDVDVKITYKKKEEANQTA